MRLSTFQIKFWLVPLSLFCLCFFASENWWKRFSLVLWATLTWILQLLWNCLWAEFRMREPDCLWGRTTPHYMYSPTHQTSHASLSFANILDSFGEQIRFFYFFLKFSFEHFCQLPFFRQCVYQKDNILLFIYVFPYAQHMSMCFSCSVSTYGLLAGNKTCFFNVQRLPLEGTQRRAEPGLWACSPLSFLLNLLQTVYDLCFDVTSALR